MFSDSRQPGISVLRGYTIIIVVVCLVYINFASSQGLLRYLYPRRTFHYTTPRPLHGFSTRHPYQLNPLPNSFWSRRRSSTTTAPVILKANFRSNFPRTDEKRLPLGSPISGKNVSLAERDEPDNGKNFNNENSNNENSNIENSIAPPRFRLNEDLPITFREPPTLPPTAVRSSFSWPLEFQKRVRTDHVPEPNFTTPDTAQNSSPAVLEGSSGWSEKKEAKLIEDENGKETEVERAALDPVSDNAFSDRFQGDVFLSKLAGRPLFDETLSDLPPLPQVDFDEEDDQEINDGNNTKDIAETGSRTTTGPTSTRKKTSTSTTTLTTPTITTSTTASTSTTTTTQMTTTPTTTTTATTPKTTTQPTKPTTQPTMKTNQISLPSLGSGPPIQRNTEELRDLPPLPDFGETDYDDLLDGTIPDQVVSIILQPAASSSSSGGGGQNFPPILIDENYEDSEGPKSPSAPPTSGSKKNVDFGDFPPFPIDEEDGGVYENQELPSAITRTTTRKPQVSSTSSTARSSQVFRPKPLPVADGDNYDDLAPVPISSEEIDKMEEVIAQPIQPSQAPPMKESNKVSAKSTAQPTQTFPGFPGGFVSFNGSFPVNPFATQKPPIREKSVSMKPVTTTKKPMQRRPTATTIRPLPKDFKRIIEQQGSVEFQGVASLFQQLFSYLRTDTHGDGGGRVPQIVNVNIGTINLNSGQNSHVIYNGHPENPLTFSKAQGASNQASQGGSAVHSDAEESPDKSHSSNWQTLNVNEQGGNQEESPDKEESEERKAGEDNNFRDPPYQVIPAGPPLPLPPIEQFDELEDFPPSPALTGSQRFSVPLDPLENTNKASPPKTSTTNKLPTKR